GTRIWHRNARRALDLVTRSTQSCLQLLPLFFPPRVLRVRPFVECSTIFFDFLELGLVLPLGLFKRPLCLCNRLLLPLLLLLPRSLFPATLYFAALLLSLKRQCSRPCLFSVGLTGRWFFVRLCWPLLDFLDA